jgi:hypothetical protein
MHRFIPVLRSYYANGGRPSAGASGLAEHLAGMTAELDTLRRTVRATLQENRRLRRDRDACSCRKPVAV